MPAGDPDRDEDARNAPPEAPPARSALSSTPRIAARIAPVSLAPVSRWDAWRRVGVIALWEARRTGMTFNKKTLAILIALAIAMALLMPVVTERGLDFDRGLYRAAVDPSNPLYPAIAAAPVFHLIHAADPVQALDANTADIAIIDGRILTRDTDKGHAAIVALRQAAKDYTFDLLLTEEDQAAAFPVRVELVYEQQARRGGATGVSGTGTAPSGTDDGADSGGTGGTSSGSTSGSGAPQNGDAPIERPPSSSGFSLLPPERSINTPETLSPPFPFRSLILAYLFLIPLNFVVQIYAGSAIGERLQRKGESLLASPASPWEIILGKALPYFALMMLVNAVIAIKIGGGWLTLLAVTPLALAFLAFEFVAAMFARSFRELTFLTVFTSVLLTIYAFLPAVFTDVHPIALVSPISLVILDLRGASVTLGEILYSVLPLTLVSAVLFILGSALYREEDLFHQKRVMSKALDALARQVRSIGGGFRLQLLLIPCVLVAELLLVAFLFAWPAPIGIVGVLLAVALVEETFKGVPSFAALTRGTLATMPAASGSGAGSGHPSGAGAGAEGKGTVMRTTLRRAMLLGAFTGLGFFVAEKGFLIASLAGLFEVPAGAAVFGTIGGGAAAAGASWPLIIGLLLAPLLLHVVTAGISATSAHYGRRTFAAGFVLAVAIHTLYNLAVVTYFGGLT